MTLREMIPSGKRLALLSRGYKRKSKGYQEVLTTGTATMYGDEPLQIKRNFPSTKVAVCIKREEGCEKLAGEGAELILLDDAFQYRALKATRNIVLIDFSRPIWSDSLLPLGRLRDLPERVSAADLVVITKCPPMYLEYALDWVPAQRAIFSAELAKLGYTGPVLFTTIAAQPFKAVFPDHADMRYCYAQSAVAVSAIAGNKAFVRDLSATKEIADEIHFGDHHRFTKSDCAKINASAAKNPRSVLVTTEKDKVRLEDAADWLSDDVKRRLMVQPIHTEFLLPEDKETYIQFISQVL